jgi:hypothetical protein
MTNPVSANNSTSISQRVTTAIADASARTGVGFDYLMDQARIESGMRPDARASTSSATGLYQFTKQTWLGTVKQHGASHGLGWAADAITQNADGNYSVGELGLRSAILDLRAQPEAAASMAAEFASDNGDYLQPRIGREAEPVDLYLAHFLGAEGAARFLTEHHNNPAAAAAPLFPAAASANRSIFYRDNGQARSLDEIRRSFAAKLGNAQSPPPLAARSTRQTTRSTNYERGPLALTTMEQMPKRLDLNFARNAYARLSGMSA